MIKQDRGQSKNGVITVFFSLVLLLILTLVTTMVEAARVSASRAIAQSVMELSTKSVLGSYYLPLYENYHVFGYWNEGEEPGSYEQLSAEWSWYLQQNTEPGGWVDIELNNGLVEGVTTLTDENGAFFYEQVLQYAKYQSVELAAEELLEALGILSQTEHTAQVMQRKYEAEATAARVEGKVLELAGCIDGFVVEDGFFTRNWLGRIKTADSFVKMLVPGFDGLESVYLDSSELYEVQKGNYRNPLEMLSSIHRIREVVVTAKENLPQLYEEEERLAKEYEELKKLLMEEEELGARLERLTTLREMIAEQEMLVQEGSAECLARWNTLQKLVGEAQSKTSRAAELLEQIMQEKEEAEKELKSYMQELQAKKEQLEPTLYEELLTEAEELLTEYGEKDGLGMLSDSSGMKEALYHNEKCLAAAKACFEGISLLESTATEWSEGRARIEEELGTLRLETLRFQYDGLFAAEEENAFSDFAKELMEYGILALVLEEPEKISEACISENELPSAGYGGNRFAGLVGLKALLSGEIGAGLSGYSEQASGWLGAGAEALLEQILYLVYVEQHFPCYSNFLESEATEQDEEVEGLLYQREYIIGGELKDDSNLAAIISKILSLRFAMNLTAILCSSECRNQAKATATAIVGFTGISALVYALQFIIELIWAAECALVECAALLMGGECSFLVSGSRLAVGFSELLGFNKTVMLTKARTYQNAGGILKSYEEYLRLFLFLEDKELRTLRTMDVVQQVLQLNASENFRLAECIGRLQVQAELKIPYRFLIYNRDEAGGTGISENLSFGTSY
ncbi:MAG: hypothetical protein IJY09_02785 [Lachnospiraceae bacterium]|nr:hypothetical protein [Lachnospiraceae bacterium]